MIPPQTPDSRAYSLRPLAGNPPEASLWEPIWYFVGAAVARQWESGIQMEKAQGGAAARLAGRDGGQRGRMAEAETRV